METVNWPELDKSRWCLTNVSRAIGKKLNLDPFKSHKLDCAERKGNKVENVIITIMIIIIIIIIIIYLLITRKYQYTFSPARKYVHAMRRGLYSHCIVITLSIYKSNSCVFCTFNESSNLMRNSFLFYLSTRENRKKCSLIKKTLREQQAAKQKSC